MSSQPRRVAESHIYSSTSLTILRTRSCSRNFSYRLKDSDVTWLYGPLHTNIDAVPPPKESTMSDRLGLEPLRTLSDSKKVALANAKKNKTKKPEIKTKPILKYRSLSDILMPSTGASPVTEDELNFDDQSTISVHHARSDSHLVRLNSLNKGRKKRGSPITSPRGTSPERAGQSDSSSASAPVKKEHRHISFNHRVEQCIAVDSTEEARRYKNPGRPSADFDDDDEGSDDEQVLTFKSSPRVASFGPSALSNSSNEWEPHTIARLGPTTLKSVEIYPAPSPVVVYQNYPDGVQNVTGGHDGAYGQPTATYSSRPGSENTAAVPSTGKRPPYDLGAVGASMRQSGWDPEDDDDYAMGFDYFNGPEVGVGDEYDTAQYGSTHLVGGTHNDFQSGGASYLGPGSSSYSVNYGVLPPSSSTDSTPNHSRRSSNNSSQSASSPTGYGSPNTTSVASASVRGPHAPTASRDAAPPKRSALKGAAPASAPSGRSRESSVESNLSSASTSPRFGTSPANIDGSSSPSPSPLHSPSLSSHSSSPSASPHSSANSLASVMATAIPAHVRPQIARRGSDDGVREARGRSASRGSSSSLERAASADWRSSSSISPSSSYSPPSPALNAGPGGGGAGAKPVQIQSSRKVGSHESLASAAHAIAASSSPSVTIVPEASSESETETVRDDEGVEEKGEGQVNGVRRNESWGGGAEVEEVEDVSIPATVPDSDDSAPTSAATTPKVEQKESLFPAPSPTAEAPTPAPTASSVSKSRPADINAPSTTESIPAGPVSPPLVPAPTSSSSPSHPSRTPGAPRFPQPSPSHATTSTSAENPPATVDGGSTTVASLSNSPQLDPADIASPQWADESAPSYARRSLLRAARGGSHTSTSSAGSNALAKTNSVDSHASTGSGGAVGGAAGRASHESGRGVNDPDYGFGYYDEDGQQDGVVSGTVKMAGTAARDMFGALSKSLWGLRRS